LITCDNFDIYGAWCPSNSQKTQEFYEEIESKGVAIVRVGVTEPKLIGTVEIVPSEEIDIKHRPNLSPH
jgi:hypothetical protein